MKRTLRIEAGSEAETYFCTTFIPLCKDEVKVRNGGLYGVSWNEYGISEDDFNRCKNYVILKQRGA